MTRHATAPSEDRPFPSATLTPSSSGPARLVLMAGIARRHYVDQKSKVEIADEFGISRFKVARLLEAARDEGVVRIEIVRSGRVDVDLSARLQQRFGLRHAVVVDTGDGDERERRGELAAAAARLLTEVLTPDDALGVPWSRTVHATSLHLRHLPPIPILQMTGSMEVPDVDSSTVDIVRRLARLAGGDSSIFHAPFLLDDVDTAAALRRQPAVARGLAAAADATRAIVAVGAWADGQSTVHDALDPAARRAAADAGVIGEVAGVVVGTDGGPVDTTLADRLVTVDHAVLRDIAEVIAIADDVRRTEVVRAALVGGLVESLVVGDELAGALLAG